MLIADATGVEMTNGGCVWRHRSSSPGRYHRGFEVRPVSGLRDLGSSLALVEQAKKIAAELLEASESDLSLDTGDGRFHVLGTPAIGISWSEIAEFLEPDASGPRLLHAEEVFDSEGPTFPFGTHVAVVEVDSETGAVHLSRLVACDDAGVILNPLLADGQVHGGLAREPPGFDRRVQIWRGRQSPHQQFR